MASSQFSTIEIWEICIKHNIWITASHIAGVENEADKPSRKFNDQLKWELNTDVFKQICSKWQRCVMLEILE